MRLVEIDYDTYIELGKAGVWVNWNPAIHETAWLPDEVLLRADSFCGVEPGIAVKLYTRVEDDG